MSSSAADWNDAARSLVWAARDLADAKTLGEQAEAFVRLSNSASDLATFIPGYNDRTGELDPPCYAETGCPGFMRPHDDGSLCDVCDHFEL